MLSRTAAFSRLTGRPAVAGACALLLGFSPMAARAATNTAIANVAGVDGDLNDSNVITLNSATLGIVKGAYLANGTALSSGSTVARGTVVKFLIYLDNTTAAALDSVNVSDVLDPTFAYQAGTIKVDASQNTGATAAAIFTAVNAATALTDALTAADVAGIAGSTISAGGGTGNSMLSVPAGKVWAMLFTVKMQ